MRGIDDAALMYLLSSAKIGDPTNFAVLLRDETTLSGSILERPVRLRTSWRQDELGFEDRHTGFG
jgi:hypothetical protein